MSPAYTRHFASLGAAFTAIIMLTAADRPRPGHRALPVLRPGSAELVVSHVRERTDSNQVSVPDPKSPTGPKFTMTRHDEEHFVDDARGPALLLVTGTSGSYSDSAWVLRSTLRPIREIQNYITRHRRIVFEYNANRVQFRDSTLDSTVRVRDHTYDGDFFHFNELNLVIRSLPLREGFEAILPLYSEGSDELEMDTVKVVGKNDAGAWTIRFADPVIVVNHTLDPTTRRIISSSGGRRPAPAKPSTVIQ